MTAMLDLNRYIDQLARGFDAQEVVRFLRPLQARLLGNKLQLLACNRYMQAWLQQHHDKLLHYAKQTISSHITDLQIGIEDNSHPANTEQEFKQRLVRAGITLQYQNADFNTLHQDLKTQQDIISVLKTYAECFTDRRKHACNLLFCGGVGTGKTTFACILLRTIISQGYWGRIQSVNRLLRDVQSCYQQRATHSEQALFDSYLQDDLLIIDDIGLQRHTENSLHILSEILCLRYDHCKPSVLISNWPAKGNHQSPGLREMLGIHLFDRLLSGDSHVLIFDWPSYRRSTYET